MEDVSGSVRYKDREYRLVFSLEVMERIQQEYGSFTKWGELCFGAPERDGEPDIRALKFGLREMLNEGILIENEDTGADTKPLTPRQVSRILDGIGLAGTMKTMDGVIAKSTDTGEKNA